MGKLSIAILLAAASLWADALDNNTVTVTASRTVTQQPDQVLLYVTLLTAQDVGLDDVLAKLKGTGITAEHLQSVYPAYGPAIPGGIINPTFSIWTFVIPAPFSKMKDTLSTLGALQKSLGSLQGANVLSFNVAGTSTSQSALTAQQCPLTALVADARRQAELMAAAAGMRAGAIVAVSDTPVASLAQFALPEVRSGIYFYGVSTGGTLPVSLLTGVLSSPQYLGATQAPCALTVQFKLQ